MTIVFHTITDPSGRALQHQLVKIKLVAPGNPFTQSDNRSVLQTYTVSTGDDGRFDAELVPTGDYEYAGAYYLVDARGGLAGSEAVWAITVPDTGGPYPLRDLVFPQPEPGEPIPPVQAHHLGDHIDVDTTGEFTNAVLKLGADGIWRPAVDQSGGGSGGGSYEMTQNIPAQVITVAHGLGFRPAGIALFSLDWATQYDEFTVEHADMNLCTVTVDDLFTGHVVAS